MAGSIWRLSYPVSRPFSARATLVLLSYTALAFVGLALFQFFTSAQTLQVRTPPAVPPLSRAVSVGALVDVRGQLLAGVAAALREVLCARARSLDLTPQTPVLSARPALSASFRGRPRRSAMPMAHSTTRFCVRRRSATSADSQRSTGRTLRCNAYCSSRAWSSTSTASPAPSARATVRDCSRRALLTAQTAVRTCASSAPPWTATAHRSPRPLSSPTSRS